jgi:hypothetical protein
VDIQCENTSLLGVSRMLHDAKYRACLKVRSAKRASFRANIISSIGISHSPKFSNAMAL